MFLIRDDNRNLEFTQAPLPAMKWVLLTERLIGALSNCDEELTVILKAVTGLETADLGHKVKDEDITGKLLKGLLKAIGALTDSEKTKVYDRIFEGCSTKTAEGGTLIVSCETMDCIVRRPSNFYLIVYECLKGHYMDFFQEATATLEAMAVEKKAETEIQ